MILTEKGRLSRKNSGYVREFGKRVGREYCKVWQAKGGRVAPVCKGCVLAKHDDDCNGQPVGYRDYIMAAARSRLRKRLFGVQTVGAEQVELPMIQP